MALTNTHIDTLLASYHYTLANVVSVGRLYIKRNEPAVLIDSTLYNLTISNFQYVDYTNYQNKLMHQFNGLYRFLATNSAFLKTELALFLSKSVEKY